MHLSAGYVRRGTSTAVLLEVMNTMVEYTVPSTHLLYACMPYSATCPDSAVTLLSLPEELICQVLGLLSATDLAGAIGTCRDLHPPIQGVLRARLAEVSAARR